MEPWIRESKNKQLKQLMDREPTEGRVKEVKRLVQELRLGPGQRAKIAVWMRLGPG